MSGATLADLDALFEGGSPVQRLALATPATPEAPLDTLRFVAFNPRGMQVRGTHDPESMPVAEQLQQDCSRRQEEWRSKILARPGGFDGHRAPVLSFRATADTLQVHTGYRTYTQSRALRDALDAARGSQDLVLSPNDLLRPRAGLSWGASLATFVLLPHEHVLCAHRAEPLATDPGIWTCCSTEILEPTDLDRRNMDKLLARLVSEELPSLGGLGQHRFVGLGVRPLSYTWQLVSVLDLRPVPLEQLVPVLSAMQPDTETAGWAVLPLQSIALDERPYPPALYSPDAVTSAHLATAQFVSRGMPAC